MSYDKQTWVKYDELKTEEENIQSGAVVTDNRMNHIEGGIGANDSAITAHVANKSNPHGITKAQLGLDKVDNIQQASKTDFDSHVNNTSNPHAVTASQVGAYSKLEMDTKLTNKAEDSDVVHNTGDETIDGKKTFTDDVVFSSDVPWTDISPINGFSLTSSTGATGILKYKIQHGVLYVSIRGLTIPALPLESPKAFANLPFTVPECAVAGFVGPNLSSSLYAKEVCTIQANGGDGNIYYAKSTATTAGDRFSGMLIVPMD